MQILESRVARTLHDEHMETLDCLGKLEGELARHRPDQAPREDDRQFGQILARTRALLDAELDSHFRFEEEVLFPLLDDAGDGGLATLLTEEHQTIQSVGRRLSEVADLARRQGLAAEVWRELRLLGLELCERLSAHIQKEEMGLLPIIDSLLDEDQDSALCEQYLLER